MAETNILLYALIGIVIALLIITILTSMAANKAEVETVRTAKNYGIAAAVISALTMVAGVAAIAWSFMGKKSVSTGEYMEGY